MKFFIAMLIFLISSAVMAAKYTVKINDIDIGRGTESHLLLLSDGQVGYLAPENKKSLEELTSIKDKEQTIEIDLNEKNQVLAYREVAPLKKSITSFSEEDDKNFSYDPTEVSLESAQGIFSRMRRDYQNRSQCYNRAHIWTYEEFKKSGLKSLKVFMFFTRRYIRNYNYYWWFHVTPTVQTADGLRALDRRYTTGPMSLPTWTRKFVYSGRTCPMVDKYSDYRDHQEVEDCYHIAVPMYFWQPYDIDQRDRTGYQKTSYIQSNVDHAYWEAF
jgi:hypothetical protein